MAAAQPPHGALHDEAWMVYMPAKGLFLFHASQPMEPSHSTKIMP
jgi:hypothetical protein